jgi:hypothetical protein
MGNPTISYASSGAQTARSASWTLVTGDSTGAAIGDDWAEWSDRSVQVTGTFGAGTIAWQISNDGTNFVTANTPAGVAISGTSAFLRQVLERARFSRPIVTGADGTTNLVVTLSAGRPTLGRS